MRRTASRLLAVALLGIAILALAIAARQSRRDHSPAADEVLLADHEGARGQVTVQGLGARPIGDQTGKKRAVRLELPEEPAIGRTVYVQADADGVGDGSSSERPLRDLQAALCGLEPGDRLIIWNGAFAGPFVIGEECQDGTREAPIEVYAAADSVLHGGGYTDEPVLTLARAHWRLNDLKVVPLESLGAGVAVRPPASDIVLESLHVRSGRGNGIEIHPGVSSVVIQDAHLHHLGIQEGGGSRNAVEEGGGGKRGGKRGRGERVDPATTPPGAGIRIYPGTRAIRVLGCEIRNIFGSPLEVVAPADHDPSLPPAADLEIDDSGFVREKQEQWW